MAFELRQLRQVLALAEHGSFSRAAATLGLSQPALSRSIQALERHLGAPLFDRASSGVSPTDMGRLFIRRADDLVRMADELDGEARPGHGLQSGRVTIGAGIYPAELIVGRAAAQCATRFPGISVDVRVSNWDDLLRQLRNRDLDFFIAEVSTLGGEQDLEVEPMSPHQGFFAARRAHPLAGRHRISPADVFRWPFVSATRLPPRVLDPLLAANRASRDPAASGLACPSVTCNSLTIAKRIVEHSDAVTAVTLSCIAAELEAGSWAVLTTAPWLSTHYGVVTLKRRPVTQAAKALRDTLVETETAVAREEQALIARWRRTQHRQRRATRQRA